MTKGDKDAFLLIYHHNYAFLFRYGFSITLDKELTKDSIQEMFMEIWNNRSSLKKQVHNVKSYLYSWLRRKISRNASILAREKKGEDLYKINDSIESYLDLLIAFQQKEEKSSKLKIAINKLTKKQIEMIKLRFFENMSYREIARINSLTIRTVYNTIYEAISNLRKNEGLLV